MCFLLGADQKSYSLFFKQLRDGDTVSRDEYPVTMKSALDLLICTEGGIHGNQKSAHENRSGRGGVTQNDAQGIYLHSNDREAPNKIQCFSLEGTALH